MEQEVYKNKSLKSALERIVGTTRVKKIFLVRGNNSFEVCGAKKICDDALKDIDVINFSDFSVNPKLEDIEKGIALFRASEATMIIAIGGGSAIDIAKSINALSTIENDLVTYIQGDEKLSNVAVPLVAIPTTAGTGSEATHFAVVYIDEKKYSLAHRDMLPEYVTLDPRLTASMSPYVTACTGFDALAQALESMWSTGSTEESKRYAKEAIELIQNSFVRAVNDPDESSRRDMQQAAYLAGKAINISKTTASHAMSYPLTSHFGIPHGHAVALTLGELLAFNCEVIEETVQDERGIAYVKENMNEVLKLLGVASPTEAHTYWKKFMEQTGLKTNLTAVGVVESNLAMLASEVSSERAKNNPRYFDETHAEAILRSIL